MTSQSPISPLPRLGVGTWAWGDRRVWGFEGEYGRPQVEQAFWASLEAGLTLFDTAEVYGFGTSERILGELVRQSQRSLSIATKYAPFRPGSRPLLRALDGSLARLGLPQVDLYQIHFPPLFTRLEGLLDVLAEAALSGKAKAVGVSNFNARQMRIAQEVLSRRGVALTSNQVEYSLLDRTPEADGVLRACRELGVTLIAYSPLAMGWLSGKYDPGEKRLPRRLHRYLGAHGPERLAATLQLLREIASRLGRTPSQVALNWLLQQPGVIIIPGAKNAQQAADNAAALGWELPPEDVLALDQVTRLPRS